MMVSVDGFIETPGEDINWHNWDEEMNAYMMSFFDTVDTFIYGRKSYELMIKYWPSETGDFADRMNETPKIIFSRNLKNVSWNSRLIKEFVREEMEEIKQQPGKDIVLFAGADIASSFIKNGLIDEYRLIVNPVALGEGTPLFKNLENHLKLNLLSSKSFKCGNILSIYSAA